MANRHGLGRGLGALLPPSAAEPAPAEAPGVPVEQLKQLAALREQGILTDEEFAAEKAKLLGI